MKKLLVFSLFIILHTLSCGTSSKIKDGKTAYDYKKYNKAIGLLKEEFQSTKRQDVRADKAFYIAESYLKLNDYIKANEWFQTSENMGYGVKALYGVASTYKNLEQYDKAIQIFRNLESLVPSDPNVKRQLFICQEAQRWKLNASDNYSLRKLMEDSRSSNYSPFLYENQFLIFTSDNEDATGGNRYDWTGNKFSDLFIIDKRGRGEMKRFDSFINSVHNDGTAVFSADFNEMYFTRCFNTETIGDDYCKLMVSLRQERIWTEPEILPFVKDKTNYGQPALIENDSVLVFSSFSEDNTAGYDLWYAVKEEGGWSEPSPMPSSINTQGDEFFPTADGDTLYFSSNYLPGMGGLDIFKTYLKPDGSWSDPSNMKMPFNSGADDFGLIIDRTIEPGMTEVEQKGYFTSTRANEGREELYYYEQYQSKDNPNGNVPIAVKEEDRVITLYLAGKILEHVFSIEDNPNSDIVSKKAIPFPNIKVTDEDNNDLNVTSNDKGLFISNLTLGKTYKIFAQKQGYLNSSLLINTKDYNISPKADSYTINAEIILDKIYKGQEVILENIYYDFNESFIREDAKPTLDALVIKLKENPQISIELSSHTDCRGEVEYNQELSQNRAQAAVDYLILKGVNKSKLLAKGYGESNPIDSCECTSCEEDQHQKNRRTSFKIL